MKLQEEGKLCHHGYKKKGTWEITKSLKTNSFCATCFCVIHVQDMRALDQVTTERAAGYDFS